jgi:hypothetical protein
MTHLPPCCVLPLLAALVAFMVWVACQLWRDPDRKEPAQ